MGCLIVVLSLLIPRVAMIFILLFTRWFQVVFTTWFWPVLGFIFLPYTTLAYMAADLNSEGSFPLGWTLLIVLAVLVDVGHWGGGAHSRRRRRRVIA